MKKDEIHEVDKDEMDEEMLNFFLKNIDITLTKVRYLSLDIKKIGLI